MSRKPKDRSWRDVDKRMRKVVKLRQDGLSLRQIADRLAVGKSTVERDLQRFETQNVEDMLSRMGVPYGAHSGPMGQENGT